MSKNDQQKIGRRSVLSGITAVAAAGIVVNATSSSAQSSQAPAGFNPPRHSLDSWMDELSGSHRVFIDSSTPDGGANGMRYANNILTVNESDYQGTAADYAIIVCFRHFSVNYGFNDAIWAKYGAGMDPRAEKPPTTNPMNVGTMSNGQNSLGSLVDKGVHFAICSRATRNLAGRLASSTGSPVDQILAELFAGAIPNGHFVPAGVMTATRAQELGYSLLYSE